MCSPEPVDDAVVFPLIAQHDIAELSPQPPTPTKRRSDVAAKFVCPSCPRSFTSDWSYRQHLRLHERKDKRPQRCRYCKALFSDRDATLSHMSQEHGVVEEGGSSAVPKRQATKRPRVATGWTPSAVCAEFVNGKAGGRLLLLDGHLYHKGKPSSADVLNWRCATRDCVGTAKCDSDGTLVYLGNEHNHTPVQIKRVGDTVEAIHSKPDAQGAVEDKSHSSLAGDLFVDPRLYGFMPNQLLWCTYRSRRGVSEHWPAYVIERPNAGEVDSVKAGTKLIVRYTEKLRRLKFIPNLSMVRLFYQNYIECHNAVTSTRFPTALQAALEHGQRFNCEQMEQDASDGCLVSMERDERSARKRQRDVAAAGAPCAKVESCLWPADAHAAPGPDAAAALPADSNVPQAASVNTAPAPVASSSSGTSATSRMPWIAHSGEATLIAGLRGGRLRAFNGYTFAQDGPSSSATWGCTKRMRCGCKARLKCNPDGSNVQLAREHNHSPVVAMEAEGDTAAAGNELDTDVDAAAPATAGAIPVSHGHTARKRRRTAATAAKAAAAKPQPQSPSQWHRRDGTATHVTNTWGARLLTYDRFTYHTAGTGAADGPLQHWQCSYTTRFKCYARLSCDVNGGNVHTSRRHNHQPVAAANAAEESDGGVLSMGVSEDTIETTAEHAAVVGVGDGMVEQAVVHDDAHLAAQEAAAALPARVARPQRSAAHRQADGQPAHDVAPSPNRSSVGGASSASGKRDTGTPASTRCLTCSLAAAAGWPLCRSCFAKVTGERVAQSVDDSFTCSSTMRHECLTCPLAAGAQWRCCSHCFANVAGDAVARNVKDCFERTAKRIAAQQQCDA